MAEEIAGAVADAASKTAVSMAVATTEGFKFSLKIEENWVAGLAIVVGGAVSLGLGAFYIAHKFNCDNAVRRALEGQQDDGRVDPEVDNIAEGSILVEMHCHTAQSFLSFLDDFETKKVKHRLEEEFCKIGFGRELRVSIVDAEQVFKTRSTLLKLGVTDNQKRWFFFGIALSKVLVTQVRSFVEQEVQKEYGNLQTRHNIHTQSTSERLKNWPTFLKYENINGNDAHPRLPGGRYNYSLFDCRVPSPVDFAKLYVENHMAKFYAFDEHCDASAVLALLGKVPVFSHAVQSAAGDVRQARNAWAHCVFSDWDPVNYHQSFDEMEKLVKAMGLLPAIETNLLGELKDWETKGTMLCMNAIMDPDLLKLVQQHVNTLQTEVEQLTFEVQEDKERVSQALNGISTSLEELEERVTSVQREQEVMKQEQSFLSKTVDALSIEMDTSVVSVRSEQDIIKQEQSSLSNKVDALQTEMDTTVDSMQCEQDIMKQEQCSLSKKLDTLQTEMDTGVEIVQCEQDIMKQEQSSLTKKVDTLQIDHDTTQVQLKSLQSQQEDVQQRVAHVEEQLSSVIGNREDCSYEGPANVVSQLYHTNASDEIASCEGDIAFFAKRHDPDTRQWFFDDFDAWFRDPGDSRAYVLLGDPAVGKSVMTAVLAQRMRRAGHLLATYFCRHNDGTRNDPRYLLGTVACQICECNSQYNTIVGGEGRVRNLLGNSKLGVQELFTKLLQEPLAKFNHNEQRKLVIIDALDETEYESREDFLDLIMHRLPLLPEWLVFFITSRPEDSVQFRLKKYNPCVKICAGISGQHNFYQQHEQDIRTFLKKRVDFSRLSCTVEDILKQCNGLFLYAHYIVEELRLSMDLNQLTDLFPGGINDFFLQNFKRVYDQVGKDIFKKLFGCAVVAPSRLPVSIISYILKREKSNHDEQQVIDAVSQFVVLRRPDYTLAFLHDLIPVWLTDNKKASRKLFIDKKIAGEYLRTIFVEILFSVVYEPRPTVPSIDDDLEQYVWRVAVRFLCQNGNKDWLKTVFSCLTSYHLMERRMQSGRKQIYHLLDDFRFVVGRFPLEEIKKQEILQGISFALESNVFVLLECPHLLHACIRNTSNAVRETVLIRQMSGPWLEWSVYALSDANIADMYCLATSPNKRTVVGARRRSLQFFDASTAKVVGGPFEVSDDLIDDIDQLEFSPDGKFIFFGRLDKWFSVERGCVEDFPQFFGNSHIYKWGVFTRDGKSIVVKRNFLFNRSTCQGKSCLFNLLALWAVKEIEQSRSNEMTVYFSPQVLCNAPGVQIKILFELLEMGTILNQTLETLALYDPSCHYCCRLKKLTESSQEASLAAVRQLVVELYPCIFNYQVWDLQSGMTVLQQVFSQGVELNPFTYLCHVTCAFSECGLKMMCCGIEKAMSVCNIAAVTATCYALFGSFYFWHGLELELELEREMKKVWQLELLERKQGRELELEWCLAQIPEPEKTQEQEKATRLEQLFQQERDFEWKQIREQDRDHFQEQVFKLVQQRELKRDWMPDMKQVHDQARKLERELKGLWELKWVQELRQERELELLLEREQKQKELQSKVRMLLQKWEREKDLKLEYERRQACELKRELSSQLLVRKRERERERDQLWKQVLEVVHQWEQGQLRKQEWKHLVGQMQKLLQQRKLGHEWVRDLKHVRQELELKQAREPALVRNLNWVVQRMEQKWKLEMQRKRKWEHVVSTGLFKEIHNETVKFGVHRNIPKGFQDLVYDVNKDIRICVSPETKWMIEAGDLLKLRFLQAEIQDGHLNRHGKPEHTFSKFTRFTFTDDDLYFVYSCEGSLHALCLQTGTILTSVTGCNLYYFRREKQVGYLFRSDTQERTIFLTNLFSPFKFVSVSPVKPSVVGKSVAAVFRKSDTVMSVSSDCMATLWQTSANKEAITFICKSLLTSSGSHELHVENCVLSSDGKLIAIHHGSKVELYSFAEPGVQQFLYSVFESKCKFTVACFAFSADSAFLLFCIRNSRGDSHFYEWNIQERVISASFKSPVLQSVECCCLSSSKRELILCGEYHIEIWEYAKHPFRLLTRLTVEKPYNSVTFRQCTISLDNQVLACCIADVILVYSLYALDIDSSKQVLRGHLGRIEFCRFIKRNRYLISYGVDGMVFLWDINEAKAVEFARIAEDQDSISSMAVSPEEDRAVCFTSSDRVCVIKLCELGSALSLKPLMAPVKGKEATVETSLQLSEQKASLSQILTSSIEDDDTFESLSSYDSEEDMDYDDLE